jgi:parallel beta-helix repeat protein
MTIDRLHGVTKVEATLVLLTALLSILSVYSVQRAWSEPVTWTVDDDGSADFQTIQEAINAAQQGDHINVTGGIYNEHVVVDRSVSLTGENRNTTIVDGSGSGTVVLVTADNVTLEGFTVRNGKSGIVVSLSQNCRIEGNLVEDNSYQGIFINKAQNCIVSRNHAVGTRPGYGINVNASQNTLVEGNRASSNGYDGIGLLSSRDSIVRGNTVNNNSLYGIWVDSSYYSLFYHNNVFGNHRQVSSNNPSNSWDNGTEGNYWGNYAGVDTDGNGVGNEAFLVDEQTLQRDRFPLMRPYVNEVYLSVDTEPPVAHFAYSPDVVFVNETVSFDASESYDSVGRNAIVGYNWDFGDGSTGTGIQINHTYLAPENVTVVLTTIDVAGNEGLASVDILVELEDTGGEQFLPAASIGVLAVGVMVGVTMLVLWFRKRKEAA